MRDLNRAAAWLLSISILFPAFGAKGSLVSMQSSAPIVVRMGEAARGIVYEVDPKPKGYAPGDNLLRILDLVHEERGANSPIVVLVDPHVRFTEIWNFDGVAGKAQMKNVHLFVFNPETKYMAELKWGPTVPYSTNPPLN